MALFLRRHAQPNASQQLKSVGRIVTGLSGLTMLWMIAGLVTDWPKGHAEDHIFAAVFLSMAIWGLATGTGLLRVRPWARLSMLIFNALLCVWGVPPVIYLFTLSDKDFPNRAVALRYMGPFMLFSIFFLLISVTIGVRGLRFFLRSDIKGRFANPEGIGYLNS